MRENKSDAFRSDDYKDVEQERKRRMSVFLLRLSQARRPIDVVKIYRRCRGFTHDWSSSLTPIIRSLLLL